MVRSTNFGVRTISLFLQGAKHRNPIRMPREKFPPCRNFALVGLPRRRTDRLFTHLNQFHSLQNKLHFEVSKLTLHLICSMINYGRPTMNLHALPNRSTVCTSRALEVSSVRTSNSISSSSTSNARDCRSDIRRLLPVYFPKLSFY